jgi:hypothetical protein
LLFEGLVVKMCRAGLMPQFVGVSLTNSPRLPKWVNPATKYRIEAEQKVRHWKLEDAMKAPGTFRALLGVLAFCATVLWRQLGQIFYLHRGESDRLPGL